MTDPTSRALSLLGLFESRSCWTAAQLADRLGVTPRTVRRDIDRLRSLGYVVESDAGPGGGYVLGRGQVVPPLLLDEEQAVSVTLALIRAAHGETGAGAEAALRALATIDAIIPSALRRKLSALRESSLIGAEGESADTAVLLACAEATRRRVRMTFAYRDRLGAEKARRVEPHRLVARARVWKLVAFDLGRNDWRTFRVDRITAPEVGTWGFSPRKDADRAVALIDEPVPPDAWKHAITVHIDAPREDVARRLPAAAGKLRELDATRCELLTGADHPDEAAMWLARIGYDFTVLGDEDVRRAVARLARRLGKAAR